MLWHGRINHTVYKCLFQLYKLCKNLVYSFSLIYFGNHWHCWPNRLSRRNYGFTRQIFGLLRKFPWDIEYIRWIHKRIIHGCAEIWNWVLIRISHECAKRTSELSCSTREIISCFQTSCMYCLMYKKSPYCLTKIEQYTLMRFVIVDTCEIIDIISHEWAKRTSELWQFG